MAFRSRQVVVKVSGIVIIDTRTLYVSSAVWYNSDVAKGGCQSHTRSCATLAQLVSEAFSHRSLGHEKNSYLVSLATLAHSIVGNGFVRLS